MMTKCFKCSVLGALIVFMVFVFTPTVFAAPTSEDNQAEYVVDGEVDEVDGAHEGDRLTDQEDRRDQEDRVGDEGLEVPSGLSGSRDPSGLSEPSNNKVSSDNRVSSADRTANWLAPNLPITAAQVAQWDSQLGSDSRTLILEESWESSLYESGEGIPILAPEYLFYLERYNKDVDIRYYETVPTQIEIEWNEPDYTAIDEESKQIKELSSSELAALEEAQEFVGDLFEVRAFVTIPVEHLHHSYEFSGDQIDSYKSINPNIQVTSKIRNSEQFPENYTLNLRMKEINAYPAPATLKIDVSGHGLGTSLDVFEYDVDLKRLLLRDAQVPVVDGYVKLPLPVQAVTEYVLVGAKKGGKKAQQFYDFVNWEVT